MRDEIVFKKISDSIAICCKNYFSIEVAFVSPSPISDNIPIGFYSDNGRQSTSLILYENGGIHRMTCFEK